MILALLAATVVHAEPPTVLDLEGDTVEITRSDVESARTRASGALEVARSLTRGEIRKVMLQAQDGFKDCYALAVARTPTLEAAQLSLALEVEPSGLVKTARLKKGKVEKKLEACALAHARTLAFPRSDGRTLVTYPLSFRTLP